MPLWQLPGMLPKWNSTLTCWPVTPCQVAPPLLPLKTGTQGGESGSAVWRGGLPTQSKDVGTLIPPADEGGGAAPPPAAPPSPRPSAARLPFGGAVLLWPGTGAYSATWPGLACGR